MSRKLPLVPLAFHGWRGPRARALAPTCRTRPPSAQVELLVMKALSVGLVRGSIDEVDKRVHMTWVQPRVLDLQQVMCLKYMVQLRGCFGLYLCCLSFIWMEAT